MSISITTKDLEFLNEFVKDLKWNMDESEHEYCEPKECSYAEFYALIEKLNNGEKLNE